MTNINGNTITLTRGDTLQATVSIKTAQGEDYVPQSGDVIRFAMKKNYCDASPVITKTIPNNTLLFELEPEDTKTLNFGKYVWDMQITYANGAVDTFIDKGTLTLTEEVD